MIGIRCWSLLLSIVALLFLGGVPCTVDAKHHHATVRHSTTEKEHASTKVSKSTGSKGTSTVEAYGKGGASAKTADSKHSKAGSGHDEEDESAGLTADGGKGKGKGSKGTKASAVDGSSKGTKSSKGGKGGKGSKSSKGSGNGDGDSPAGAPSLITPSPTSVDSIGIRGDTYALFYTLSESRIPTTEEYAQLADVTRLYLEEFIFDEFSQTSLTNIDDFVTFMERNAATIGQPVQADYRSSGLFNPSSIFLPTVREVNGLVDEAFMTDNLATYVGRVQGLSTANVFSSTVSVTKGSAGTTTAEEALQGTGFIRAGVVAAAAGLLVLVAGAMVVKRHGAAKFDEFDEKVGLNLKGDAATTAEDTCDLSLDDSSSWRQDSPYAEEEEAGFMDEPPLDNDEDEEYIVSRRLRPRSGLST